MGQKAKNAGKKKQMPPKAKVSCLPKTAYTVSKTPEAIKTLNDIFKTSGVDIDGQKRGTLYKANVWSSAPCISNSNK